MLLGSHDEEFTKFRFIQHQRNIQDIWHNEQRMIIKLKWKIEIETHKSVFFPKPAKWTCQEDVGC